MALNQLCLAPITITVAFAWNLALTGQARELPAKLRRDFTATMLNGWRFWVPAATVNFVAVPLQYQVRGRGRGDEANAQAMLVAWHRQRRSPGQAELGPGCASHLVALQPPPPQVLYMSTCGMLWTGYLSYQSAQQAK